MPLVLNNLNLSEDILISSPSNKANFFLPILRCFVIKSPNFPSISSFAGYISLI